MYNCNHTNKCNICNSYFCVNDLTHWFTNLRHKHKQKKRNNNNNKWNAILPIKPVEETVIEIGNTHFSPSRLSICTILVHTNLFKIAIAFQYSYFLLTRLQYILSYFLLLFVVDTLSYRENKNQTCHWHCFWLNQTVFKHWQISGLGHIHKGINYNYSFLSITKMGLYLNVNHVYWFIKEIINWLKNNKWIQLQPNIHDNLGKQMWFKVALLLIRQLLVLVNICTLSTLVMPYILSLLGATAVFAGDMLLVLLQNGGSHYVHVTVQVVQ